MDVVRVWDEIGRHLRQEGHPIALAGAFALNAYGLGRATADLDVVVPLEAQTGLVKLLEALGYETLHRSEGFSNHLHADPKLGRVDVIYLQGDTSTTLFREARRIPSSLGLEVLVPRPEHLIAMKVHAIRNDPRRRLRDLADIGFLLGRDDVDRESARRYFEQADLMEAWDELQRSR